MDHFLIIVLPILALALIIGGVIFLHKKSNPNGNNLVSAKQTDSINSKGLVTAGDVQGGEIVIPIEVLPATIRIDEKSLFEITDSTVISRVSELIPFTSQTGTRLMANNAINSLKGTELIKMDIPFSRLTKSKDVAGAAARAIGIDYCGVDLLEQGNSYTVLEVNGTPNWHCMEAPIPDLLADYLIGEDQKNDRGQGR